MKLFVYGTLKRGKPLYSFYMKNAKFIKEDNIEGYKMYRAFTGIPYIIETGNKSDTVPGEIFEIPEKDYQIIKEMELEAGYIEKEIDGMKIFVYEKEKLEPYIKNGSIKEIKKY